MEERTASKTVVKREMSVKGQKLFFSSPSKALGIRSKVCLIRKFFNILMLFNRFSNKN